jgi:glutamine synthetase
MSRYILHKLAEKRGYSIELHPKPIIVGEWNGSGLHTNFSNKKMREVGGEEYFKSIFNAFDSRHKNHIEVYGSDNHMRLTGKHETQSIDKFSVGVSDRGASIRIPAQTATNDWKGYLEDRRPASNANPYDIIWVISETLKMSEELYTAHNNMTSNVSHKEISELYGKYKTLSPEDLLKEYRED